MLFISTLFWLTAFPIPVRVKPTSQKLVLARISNKDPFRTLEVVGAYSRMDAYSRGSLFNNSPDRVDSYLKEGAYSRIYGKTII